MTHNRMHTTKILFQTFSHRIKYILILLITVNEEDVVHFEVLSLHWLARQIHSVCLAIVTLFLSCWFTYMFIASLDQMLPHDFFRGILLAAIPITLNFPRSTNSSIYSFPAGRETLFWFSWDYLTWFKRDQSVAITVQWRLCKREFKTRSSRLSFCLPVENGN
jgi:hypothetical protein